MGAALWLAAVFALACGRPEGTLRIATTTSVDNSGLLDAILPSFRAHAGVEVQVLAVGSGRALELVQRGDADVALTHDPDAEAAFLKNVPGTRYRKIMFNDFLIVGPADDEAGVAGAVSAADAMRQIARSVAMFASRGDRSGTHAREQQLWRAAGAAPPADRLLDTGQGMAATLRIAQERRAYTLTDRATFMQLSHTIGLRPLFEGDPQLLNTYAVLVAPRSSREPAALRFMEWMADGEGRSLIAAFTVSGSRPFAVWPSERPRHTPGALPH